MTTRVIDPDGSIEVVVPNAEVWKPGQPRPVPGVTALSGIVRGGENITGDASKKCVLHTNSDRVYKGVAAEAITVGIKTLAFDESEGKFKAATTGDYDVTRIAVLTAAAADGDEFEFKLNQNTTS